MNNMIMIEDNKTSGRKIYNLNINKNDLSHENNNNKPEDN